MKKDSYYLRKFLGYALIYRGFSLAVFLMSFFAPFVRIAIPFLFSNFIDVITYGHDFKKAIYWATILLAVILLSSILGSIQQYFTEKYRQKLSIELRKSFMERFLKTELGYSTKMGSGYYLARMQEVVQLRNIMIDSFAGIVSSIILSIIGIISLLHINRWVGLVFLISIFPALWSAIFPQKKTQAKSREATESEARLTDWAQVCFSEAEKIKSRSLDKNVISRFSTLASSTYTKEILLEKWKDFWRAVFSIVDEPFYMLAYVICGFYIMKGSMTIGELIAVNWLANIFTESSLTAFTNITQISASLPACIRVLEILEKEPKIKEGPENLQKQYDDAIPQEITFADVGFHYPDQERIVLSRLDFEVQLGEHVCLVGKSGSGKSTIFKLLLRIYDPIQGTIKLGEDPIQNYSLANLRKLVDYLPQEPLLFPGTIMENLLMVNNKTSEADIVQRVHDYGLDDFMKTLGDGFQTELSGEGRGISQGQKQIISLISAIVKGSRILLLDEPTSSLDPFLEAKYEQVLTTYGKGRIVIVIAHRSATLLWGDRCLILNNGRIEDEGNHEALLARNQIYQEYFKEISEAGKPDRPGSEEESLVH